MINKNELPSTWELKKLGDVCEKIVGGGTPSTSNPEFWDGDIPWISSADIYGLKNIKPRKGITPKAIEKSTTNLLPEGSIIVVTRVGLGKIAIAPFDLCFSQDSQGLILNEIIISKSYALLCLSKAVQMFKYESRGTTISGVTKKQLVEVEIPLPPLAEQERIVAKIEELFSELDAGLESLRTAQAQLKTYRQAVLKYAFEGKLSNDKVDEGKLPNDWKWVKIVDLAEPVKNALKAGPFGSSLKKEFYVESGYKIYGQEQVINGDPYFGDYYVSEEKYQELNSNKIKPFDVLISLVGTVGKVLILPENCKAGIINPRLIKISLDTKKYLPHFFKYYFESSTVKSFYSSKAQGTTMDVLNLGIIKTIPFPLCSLEKQQRIVEEIESRLSVCDKLEETINTSLKQAESLRQSILKQAFEGRLVSQDERGEEAVFSNQPDKQMSLFM